MCLVAPLRTVVVANAVKCDLFSAFNLLSHVLPDGTGSPLHALHHVFLHHVHECAAFTQGGRSSNTK